MKCTDCYYLKARIPFPGYSGPKILECCRYPAAVKVDPTYGCGEFKKRDGRRKKV